MERHKIELSIVDILPTNKNSSFALVLKKIDGNVYIPIIVGLSEAQAIHIEIENIAPTRPLVYDLVKEMASKFSIQFKEIVISDLVDGIFYAKILCTLDDKTIEIDSRPSDAIALALRIKCPIYIYDNIMGEAGIKIKTSNKGRPEFDIQQAGRQTASPNMNFAGKKEYAKQSITELKERLKEAVEHEDYEEATIIRDEISRRKKTT